MSATILLKNRVAQATSLVFRLMHVCLLALGLILSASLATVLATNSAVDDLKSALPGFSAVAAASPVAASAVEVPDVPLGEALTPQMRGALDYVARRYRVSQEALGPVFEAAQSTGRELRLDPLLIVAVIGIESGFNPLSESVVGAQGLMQVMPRYHRDKLPDGAGKASFFDPVTNIQIGAQILREAIERNGDLANGLQLFAGAADDPGRAYAAKVLAEKQRLEQASRRIRGSSV